MNEYIFNAIFILSTFAFISYLKRRFLKENKWKTIVMDLSAFLLIIFLFVFGHVNENRTSLTSFKTLLIVLTVFYFGYKIIKDIRLLKAK